MNKPPASVVGLDLGIKDFVVTSNGEKLKNEVKVNASVNIMFEGLIKNMKEQFN